MRKDKGFGKCSVCDCKKYDPTIMFTNSKDNLSNIDYIFVMDYPIFNIEDEYKDYIDQDLFKKLDSNNIKYMITFVSICKVDDIDSNQYNMCINNLKTFIKLSNPKLAIICGTFSNSIFDITDINKCCIQQSNMGIDIISADINKQNTYSDVISYIKEYIFGKSKIDMNIDLKIDTSNINQINTDNKVDNILDVDNIISDDNKYMYKIPSDIMDPNKRMIDVQHDYTNRSLLVIMRDSNNNKIYRKIILPERNYYWYENTNTDSWVEKHNKLELKFGSYSDRCREEYAFESDVKLADKFIADYYLQKSIECELPYKNIFMFDIEIYNDGSKIFPDPKRAAKRINAISFKTENLDTEIYLLRIDGVIDSKFDDVKSKYDKLTVFDNEVMMIRSFIKRMHQISPDYISGWYSDSFDIPYILNRMKKLNMNINEFSPLGYVKMDKWGVSILGYIPLDMVWLYKSYTYTVQPSYKLDFIANLVLGINKVQHDESIDEMYENDIDKFIRYSIQDTDILDGLNDKLMHIGTHDELRKECATTHNSANSTLGQANGVFYKYLKEDSKSYINAKHYDKSTIKGGYVRDPIGGVYDWVVDLDYTSLYPSITNSCNIGPNTYIAKLNQNDARMFIYDRESMAGKDIEITINPTKSNHKTEILSWDKFLEYLDKYDAIVTSFGTIFCGHKIEKSIFFDIIDTLFKQRSYYKKLMNKAKSERDEKSRRLYYSKQMAFKILLNSLYGVLAERHFRFYNLDLAASITCTGRELIKFAGEHIDLYMHDDNPNIKINPRFMQDVLSKKDYLLYCDTDSLFLWMKPYLERKNMIVNENNVQSEIDKIQTFLNGPLLDQFCDLHNIDKTISMFEMKNELVAKRYYTLNVKKRYALYIVKSEGVPIPIEDSLEIKGMETQRSDIPTFSINMLKQIISMILYEDNTSIDDIMKIVDTNREKAMDLIINRDLSMFRPVSFSKELNEYKTIPQHIRGMKLFNELEYDYFRYGHKGILINITGFDIDKMPEQIINNYNNKVAGKFNGSSINSIVVPEDSSVIPDYYILDKDKILSFALDDRANLLLEPLLKVDDSLLSW